MFNLSIIVLIFLSNIIIKIILNYLFLEYKLKNIKNIEKINLFNTYY